MGIRSAWILPLLLAACTASPVPGTASRQPAGDDPLAAVGRWNLQAATAADRQPIATALPNGRAVHALVFDGGTLAIEGGCNHIGGTYTIDAQGALVVSEIQSTLMACADQALMDADATISSMLQGRSHWRIAESHPEQLHMDHADGRSSSWVADRPAR
jgi:heat shock protein HslJ